MTRPLRPTAPATPTDRCHHPASLEDAELVAQCQVRTDRSGGPGGQNRNKLETAVFVRHEPTGIEAAAHEYRTQLENKRLALRRLRLELATRWRAGAPRPAKPVGRSVEDFLATLDASIREPVSASGLWRSRVRGRRIVCSPEHADYPSLLAEAMDAVAASGWDPRPAAERLGVTPTQLVRFVKDHAPALEVWNAERHRRGLHALK
ncbi:MAG: peptide chain release factor-like protein [Isosphaera sp.]|nr:peptide chain release factor-like protein [Isosphaera sp.]